MHPSVQTLNRFKQERMVMTCSHSLVMSVQELARRNGIHHIPVMRNDNLVGIVCTCDMMFVPPDTPVGELMKPPVTLTPGATVESAALLMKEKSVGCVVLVKNDFPCGIVTRGDIFVSAPETAEKTELPRCTCCGIARHLRTTNEGLVMCIFCAGAASIAVRAL